MVIRSTQRVVVLRGPAALVGLIVFAAILWWSFDRQRDRHARRAALTRQFLTIETPTLAELLAVQQQRVRAATGSFTPDAGTLVESHAARFGEERLRESVYDYAGRHRIAVTAAADGFTITVNVRDDGGAAYSVAVDAPAGRVTRTCDDDFDRGECRGGVWPAGIEDRHLLGP